MLAKDGVQAWLVDSDGAEIEHGVSFSDKAHEICAEVVIDAGKRYEVHWCQSPGSQPASYWNEVSVFAVATELEPSYHKTATSWMNKDDPSTQSRTSRRLHGQFKEEGMTSPEKSCGNQHAVRLTFRGADIHANMIKDEDGYSSPDVTLLRSKYTRPDISFKFYFKVNGAITRSSNHARQKRPIGRRSVYGSRPSYRARQARKAQRSTEDSPLTVLSPTPEPPISSSKRRKQITDVPYTSESPEEGRRRYGVPGSRVLPSSTEDSLDRKLAKYKKKREASRQSLNAAVIENKKWKELERCGKVIQGYRTETQRLKADTESCKERFSRLPSD